MKPSSFSLSAALLLSGCLGDSRVTLQSPPEPVRSAAPTSATVDLRDRSQRQFTAGRVYLITRLETAEQSWGQWRARGESIRENGSRIEFRDLDSAKMISFIAPHQITPTNSLNGHTAAQFRNGERYGAVYP